MNRLLVILLSICTFHLTKGQGYPNLDRVTSGNPRLYEVIQQSWIANEHPNRLALSPVIFPLFTRHIPLRPSEGSWLQVFEADIHLRYTIAMGRESSNDLYRRGKFTFDYSPNFRMLSSESLPLTPMNNKVGFGLNFNIWNSILGFPTNSEEPEPIVKPSESLHLVDLLVQAHHYSNGQAPGIYYYPNEPDLTQKRNDYLGGDFSTNYLYAEFTFGQLYNHTLKQLSLGIRLDGAVFGLIPFSEEQEYSYGKVRLRMTYCTKSAPKKRIFRKLLLDGKGCPDSWKQDGVSYLFYKTFCINTRFWAELITSNLDNYQANALDRDGVPITAKYRLSAGGMLELAPSNHRSVGYFAMLYAGRDYLNVRYDDIIWTFQAGLTITFNKYVPATWQSKETVYGIANEPTSKDR
ncbi:MAG: hypothetical protein HYZ16_07405 [Bacteroidetes bacterium]|nr:hypothetical protein [Bacteroidota bacterium]